jgi:hypothetical protein
MKVFNKKLSELKQYEFNNRKHPEEQVKRIAKSIKEFGFNQPILIDKDGEIIAGHGRYLASLSLGLEEVPCVYPEKELSEKEIRALRVLDNKLQNDSTWDFENVSLELDWLEDSGLDLGEWGLGDLQPLNFEPINESELGNLEDIEEKKVQCPSCELVFSVNKDTSVKN